MKYLIAFLFFANNCFAQHAKVDTITIEPPSERVVDSIVNSVISLNPDTNGYSTISLPAIENKTTIFNYLTQNLLLDTNNNYYVIDSLYGELTNIVSGIPAVMIFNNKGELLHYTNSSLGCMNPTAILSALSKNEAYPIDSAMSLDKMKHYLVAYTPSTNIPADYTFLVSWIKCLGMPGNNANVVEYENAIKGNKKITSNIIKVNLDVQEAWQSAYQKMYLKIWTNNIDAMRRSFKR
jgi:hypothetical protein